MAIGRIPDPIEVAGDQPWFEQVSFFAGTSPTDRAPTPVTNVSVSVALQGPPRAPGLNLAVGDPALTVVDHIVTIDVSADRMGALLGGNYNVAVRATDAYGRPRQLRWVMPLRQGIGDD